MKFLYSLFMLVLSCTLSACTFNFEEGLMSWKNIVDGLERIEYSTEINDTNIIVKIFKIDSSEFDFKVENNNIPLQVNLWRTKLQADMVINGGYFLENYEPAGLLVVNGKTISERMFDQDKSGLIAIKNNNLTLRDLSVNPIDEEEIFDYAIQSYPFFIKNGKKSIKEDSGLLAKRTAIGSDIDGNTYIIIVDKNEISLYSLMNILYELPINFENVLNLDGGPSTSMSLVVDEYKEVSGLQVIPNVFVIDRKNKYETP